MEINNNFEFRTPTHKLNQLFRIEILVLNTVLTILRLGNDFN